MLSVVTLCSEYTKELTSQTFCSLLGHEGGAKPGDGKGQKDQLRMALAPPVEPEVRTCCRIFNEM